jgi:hypothetical protein
MFFFGLIQPIYCEIKVTVTFHFPDRVKSLRVPKTAVIVDNHSFYHKTLKIFLLPSARAVTILCCLASARKTRATQLDPATIENNPGGYKEMSSILADQ